MARWTASAKWAAGQALDGRRDLPLALRLSEGLGGTAAPACMPYVGDGPIDGREALAIRASPLSIASRTLLTGNCSGVAECRNDAESRSRQASRNLNPISSGLKRARSAVAAADTKLSIFTAVEEMASAKTVMTALQRMLAARSTTPRISIE